MHLQRVASGPSPNGRPRKPAPPDFIEESDNPLRVAYGNEGSPRVWFVKAEGEHFELLASSLAAELAKPIHGPNDQVEAFKPHITLARKKGSSPRPPPVVLDLEFAVTKFALVKSTLTSAGPAYQILEEFSLLPAIDPEPSTSISSDLTEENE